MPASPERVRAQLAALKRTYVAGLPEKLSAIERAFRSAFSPRWKEQSCADAYRLIHSLAGSAGTYGFGKLGRVARSAEALLKRSVETKRALSARQQSQAKRLVAELRQLADGL
jgi:HPt (histidine-containing phosphotransfer) domain-containing protein